MDFIDPSNPILPTLLGSGIGGLLITIGLLIVGFVASAFFTALWVRLILLLMRKALDREYGRVRLYDYSRGAEYLDRGPTQG